MSSSPRIFYVDEPLPTYYVELSWRAADVGAGEQTIIGDSLAVAEALILVAARFSLEHASGVRAALSERGEWDEEGRDREGE